MYRRQEASDFGPEFCDMCMSAPCECGERCPECDRFHCLCGLAPQDEDDRAEQDDQFSDALEDGPEDSMTDAEADADTLASAGWGTDEDYGYFGPDE